MGKEEIEALVGVTVVLLTKGLRIRKYKRELKELRAKLEEGKRLILELQRKLE